MIRIIWSPRSVEDLDAIRNHIARDSDANADLVLARLLAAPGRLRQFPESGRIVPEFGLTHLREIIVGPLQIVYRLRGDFVEIVTVIRATRIFPDLHDWLTRKTSPLRGDWIPIHDGIP